MGRRVEMGGGWRWEEGEDGKEGGDGEEGGDGRRVEMGGG